MFPPQSTPREKAAAGNGDYQNWMEYEGDVNRAPDWMGSADPDYNQPMAIILDPEYRTHLAIQQLERWFDEQNEQRPIGDNDRKST